MVARMSQPLTMSALTLIFAGFVSAAPVPAPPPPDNGPSAEALRAAVAVLDNVNGNTKERSQLWCAVADLRRKLKDRQGAADALALARRVAETSKEFRIEEWGRQIGKAYGRLGDAKAVIDLAASIPRAARNQNVDFRDIVLLESAKAACDAGQIREAEKIADELTNERTKTAIKAQIQRQALIHRAKAGDVAGAIRAAGELPTAQDKVFALVGQDVLNLTYDDRPPSWEEGIAWVQLAAGDKAGAKVSALKALALLSDAQENRRSSAPLTVVQILASMDDIPSAQKAMPLITAMDPKAVGQKVDRLLELKATGYLAAAEVRAGQDDLALARARDFPAPGQQAYLFQVVALAQSRAGRKEAAAVNFERAIKLVAANPKDKGTSLHNLASAQALAGDFAAAAKTAEQYKLEHAWQNLVAIQAKAGDYLGARKTAETHIQKGSSGYPSMCQLIARTQARAGQVTTVKEWVEKEEERLLKAYLLVGLAEGLYREGGKVPAQR
jgi:hypothetical protein